MVFSVQGLVGGVVQGVGFRAFVKRNAVPLGINGSATNLPDGRVKVVLQGTPEKVEELQCLVAKGPTFAKVASVCWEQVEVPDQEGFVIR